MQSLKKLRKVRVELSRLIKGTLGARMSAFATSCSLYCGAFARISRVLLACHPGRVVRYYALDYLYKSL